jgi:hypothetical protein
MRAIAAVYQFDADRQALAALHDPADQHTCDPERARNLDRVGIARRDDPDRRTER